MQNRQRSLFASVGILAASFGLAYAPLPGVNQTITIVSGSELQEPLAELEAQFEAEYPDISLEIEIQGSQDMVNNFIDDRNSFTPTVLIPANGQLLTELETRWQAQNSSEAFYREPQAIAKTMLVGIAWPERGQVLFPDGQFNWQKLEAAIRASSWSAIGGQDSWGSFDFMTTDASRSNSGQLTLSLWAAEKLGTSTLNAAQLNDPQVAELFSLVKQSVYQPPRSTDILLQEFITRGPNDADVAMVYESIALYRWSQASETRGEPYQVYYLNPTIETISTAAIVQRDVSRGEANAAQTFIDFLLEPAQQSVFIQHGFRPANASVNLQTVPNSPWSENIPGAAVTPQAQVNTPPDRNVFSEIVKLWQRAN